jgi:hypothetical protein
VEKQENLLLSLGVLGVRHHCAAESEIKDRKMQEAVDLIQNRYGVGKVTRGLTIATPPKNDGKRLLSAGGYSLIQ